MSNTLFIREMINAGWVILAYAIVATLFFGYLLPRMRSPGWYADHVNKVGLSIILYFIGTGTYRGFASLALWADRIGHSLPAIVPALMVMAAMLALAAGLCMIRLFTPPSDGVVSNRPWQVSLLLVSVTIAITWIYG